MVSPRTRGIRGRGTRLKRKAVKTFSSSLIAIICALFSIGLTLDGISLTIIGEDSVNLLALVGLILGTVAIISAIRLWSEGRKLHSYYKHKKSFTQKFIINIKKRKKINRHKKDEKKSRKDKSKKSHTKKKKK